MMGTRILNGAVLVPNRENVGKRDVCNREGSCPHQNGQVLCLQGNQQETHGGTGVYGASMAYLPPVGLFNMVVGP